MMEPDSVFVIGMVVLGIVGALAMSGFGISFSFRSFNFSFRFG